jgi:PAS domain S-box-containing protein
VGYELLADETPDDVEPHLRAVIERQPIALARVARDGTFLAVNETALPMFGAESIEEVVGTSIVRFAAAEQREPFEAFLTTAADGGRGSFSVDVTNLTGQPHALDVRASRHPGAPDGIPSSLLAFHDVSAMRRLEHALESASRLFQQEDLPTREQLKTLQQQFEALQSEKRELLASSALLRVEATYHRHTADDQSARLAALESSRATALASMETLQAAVDERDTLLVEQAERLRQLDEERRQAIESAAELTRMRDAHEARANELAARVEQLESAPAPAPSPAAPAEGDVSSERRIVEVADLTVRLAEVEAAHATHVSELAVSHAARLATLQRSVLEQQREHEQRASEMERSSAERLAAAERLHASELARLDSAHAVDRSTWQADLHDAREALAAATQAHAEMERRRADILQAIASLAREAASLDSRTETPAPDAEDRGDR